MLEKELQLGGSRGESPALITSMLSKNYTKLRRL